MILGTYVCVGKTVLHNGTKMNDIQEKAHVLNYSHGRCVVGAFDTILQLGSIWTGHSSVLSFIFQK